MSGAQQLIQTILTIRGLQQQDAAAALAREQFGLAKAATGEQMLGHLGTLASSLPDPTKLLPHVQSIADRTGLDPETLTTIFSNAAPGEAVTKGAVVARGAKAAGSALDKPAAYSNIVGAQPGGLEQDAFHGLLARQATDWISSLSPEKQQVFKAGVASQLALGKSPGEAAIDNALALVHPDELKQFVEIGKGFAPSADATIQGRLGAGRLALDQNVAAADAAYKSMMASAAMAEAQARLKGPELDKALGLIKNISDYQQFLTKNSGTFTEEGQVRNNAALNAMYKELQAIDPHVGSLFEPVDINKPLSATSPFGAFMQKLRQKP